MPPASDIPLDVAGIISTVLEGVLYGFSIFMGAATVWVLKRGRKWKDVHKLMLFASFLLFAFSTAVSCNACNTDCSSLLPVAPLHRHQENLPRPCSGPIAYFSDVSQETFVSKNGIYTAHTALGDGVVIYRCYMVWRKIWVIVLPMILWWSVLASGIGTVYTIAQVTPESGNIFAANTARWITAFYATTLACNFMATALLAYRLWSAERGSHVWRSGRSSIRPVLLIVVDAGVLYSITLFCALILFVSQSRAQYVVLDMITPIISISFYMVLLRVGLKSQEKTQANGLTALSSGDRSGMRYAPHASYYRRDTMQVHISRLTETQILEQDKTFAETGINGDEPLSLHSGDSPPLRPGDSPPLRADDLPTPRSGDPFTPRSSDPLALRFDEPPRHARPPAGYIP
ncbi:hypothetical protein GGF50DRAFT_53811 [Schizophyllum commune]